MPSPLSSSGRASARPLQLADYPEGVPVGWDKAAYFGTVNFLDAQNDTFKVKLTGGATYDVFSTSTYDPHTLVVYDADGNAVAWDTNANALDFGEDSVLGFKATYTGDHYIAASWSFGINTVFGFIEVYEDADTIPPSTFVYGTAGDDVFRDGPFGQRFEGGPGRDAFEARDVGRRGATVQAQAGGDILVRHGDGQIDTLARIEEVRFADGRLVFDPSDPAAQVVRLYQAALGRAPDQGGLNAWTTALEAGAPLEDLARGFLGSAEFALRMGADLSDGAVVARLYQNVLRRAPDQGGYDYWTGALQHGTTRAGAGRLFRKRGEQAEHRPDARQRHLGPVGNGGPGRPPLRHGVRPLAGHRRAGELARRDRVGRFEPPSGRRRLRRQRRVPGPLRRPRRRRFRHGALPQHAAPGARRPGARRLDRRHGPRRGPLGRGARLLRERRTPGQHRARHYERGPGLLRHTLRLTRGDARPSPPRRGRGPPGVPVVRCRVHPNAPCCRQ